MASDEEWIKAVEFQMLETLEDLKNYDATEVFKLVLSFVKIDDPQIRNDILNLVEDKSNAFLRDKKLGKH